MLIPTTKTRHCSLILARGENARTAYLSLTRGDGGQNIIGPELFESLGVIRTEELLQARRLDGAEQYFARAFDYGFSKTLDEAKSKWDEKIILCDTVRAIRHFPPARRDFAIFRHVRRRPRTTPILPATSRRSPSKPPPIPAMHAVGRTVESAEVLLRTRIFGEFDRNAED